MQLIAETQRLLRKSKRPRKDLAELIGVTRVWLRDFERGVYTDPGVNKVQKLYEALAGRKLL